MPLLERTTKAAATISILLILGLELTFHRDLTPALSVAVVVAFLCGWLAAVKAPAAFPAAWILVAPLTPLAVRALTTREGPVVDLVWLAGLAGTLIRTGSWVRWSLPPAWAALAGGWAMTLTLAWPVLFLREIPFGGRPAHWSDITLAVSLAPEAVGWMLYMVLLQLVGVLWLDWIVQHAGDRPRFQRVADAFWGGATIASVIAIYQGTIGIGFGSAARWILDRRATGTMLDANAFGVCAAFAGPVAFALLRARPGWMGRLAPVVLAINLAGLWMSGSRTALVCGIAGLAGLAMANSRRREFRRPALATIAASLIVVVLLAVTASAVGPVRRLLELPDSPRAALSSLWSRGGYGTVAMRMIREYPLTGVGIGTYRALASDYNEQINHLPLAPDNAQNWWRHQVAELGLVGALPVIAISAAILWLILVPAARPERRASVTIARSLLVGVGLSSLLGMPTQNGVVLLWFMALVAWVIASTDSAALWLVAGRTRVVWAVCVLVALVYAGGHIALARESLSPQARAIRWHHPYVVGAYPPELAEGSGEFRWTRETARFIWPAETRWGVLRVWTGHPDIARAPVDVAFSDHCGVFYTETFHSPAPVRVGFPLRDGEAVMDVVTHVSRTWRPAASGDPDPRTLGLGVQIQFAATEAEARSVDRWVPRASCRETGSTHR